MVFEYFLEGGLLLRLPVCFAGRRSHSNVVSFYAPNFGEVEGAYWFGPVRPSVCP